MKISNLCVAAAIGITCLASCTTPTPGMTESMASSSTRNETLLSDQVFRAVNRYRQDRTKKVLIRQPGLDLLAREHAQYLSVNRGRYGRGVRNANHNGFGRRAMKAQSTMGFQQVAENVVLCRNGSAGTLVSLWAQSPAHEKSMRGPYACTGIGTVVDQDGMVFSVQLFGSRHPSTHMPSPSFATY